MKEASAEEIVRTGCALRAMCDRYGATLILDDRVELVGRIAADGVHLGKHDMAPDAARRLLGPRAIVGGTANTFEEIERLVALGVDYIGLGPYRFTQTKKNLSPILGAEGYRRILAQCRARGFDRPIVAIGGIGCADIPELLRCGVAGVALSGVLLRAADAAAETEKILETIQNNRL